MASKEVKITEVKIRSSDQEQKIIIHSTACYPHDVPTISWCDLIAQDDSPPSDDSIPYCQLHEFSLSKWLTIANLCHHYKERNNLKILFIIYAMNQTQLDTVIESDPTLRDIKFSIVVISNEHKQNIGKLFRRPNNVKVTVASSSGVSEPELQIITQHIVREKIYVSLADGISGIYLSNSRLICSFLESVYVIQTENIDCDWMKKIMELFSQDVHFDAVFVKDFIFFFNLAYAKFSNCAFSDHPEYFKTFLKRCINKLLTTPVESIMESLICFIERGDCPIHCAGTLSNSSIFEHTAKSFVSFCQTCSVKKIDVIFLLLSIGIKFYHCCDMLKETNNLWQTCLLTHYKSNRLSIGDIDNLSSGLNSMSIILADHPQLMITWKEFSSLIVKQIHSFLFLKRFIRSGVSYLTRNSKLFCMDFLDPLTKKYLTASVTKEAKNSIAYDSKLTWVHDGIFLISFLVSLIEEHHWCMDDYIYILEQWVTIVMNVVDLSSNDDITQLIKWISKGHEIISFSTYQKVFSEQLEYKLVKQLECLPIESFVEIIVNESNIDKSKMVIEYLSRPHESVNIATEPLCSLIVLASNILSSSSSEFISYLKNVMKKYSESGRSLWFVLDLMSLDLHFDGLFNNEFLDMLTSSITSTNVQEHLNKNLLELFHYVPLTKNSFNLLLLKKIIEISFPNWTIDDIITALSTVFNDSQLTPAHFSTVRFECALELFLQIEKDVSYDIFTSDNKQLVIVFSVWIQNIWQTFKKNQNKIHTIESFHEATKQISGFPELVKIVSEKFKPLLSGTTDMKNVVYNRLENLISYYSVYDAMYSCVSDIFKDVNNVTKEQLRQLKSCCNEQVEKIQNILVKMQHGLPCHVKSILSMYGIEFPKDLDSELNEVVTAVCESYQNPDRSLESYVVLIRYYPQPSATITVLESFVENLSNFMKPLKSIDVLAFNCVHQSVLLSKYIAYYRQFQLDSSKDSTADSFDDCQLKMKQLNSAIEQASSNIEDLIKKTLTMELVVDVFTTADLCELDIQNENMALRKFYQLTCNKSVHIDLCDIFTPFLELYDVHEHILNLQKVCSSFNLANCLADPLLNELSDIANQVLNQSMTAKETKEKVERIKEIFGIEDSLIDHPCFCLFSSIQNSFALHTFAKERNYVGTNGMDTFIQEHRLVTTELLHNDQHEELLAVLMSAMQLIYPFFEGSFSVTELWNEINEVGNVEVATEHLITVNDNIDTIKELFNQAIGENTENNGNILKAIICNGEYRYTFCNGHHVEMTLRFSTNSGTKVWFQEAIDNFSQELSFLKIEEEILKSHMKWFKYYQPFAANLHKYYSELQYHGHPLFRNPNPKCFKLTHHNSDLEIQANICKIELQKFKDELIKNRETFNLLSFINAHKLKSLYDNLIQQDPDIDEILRDIGSLVTLDKNSYPILKSCVESLQSAVTASDDNLHPAQVVGQFLNEFIRHKLIIEQKILSHLLTCPSVVSSPHSATTGDPVMFSLISAFEYTNMDLIRLIYFIFNESFPMFYQLFRCSVQTTGEEIDLFFDRIQNFPQAKYLVMGINLIENELQQVFLERCSKLKHAITAENIKCSTKLCIYIVEYLPSLFHHIPWISLARIELPEFEKVVKACQAQKISTSTYFKKFKVVYGLPGSGKTHYIRSRIKEHIKSRKNVSHKTLSINETFNQVDVIRSLKEGLPLMSYDMLYHLNVNLIWPQTKDSESSFFQLVDDINWFFFDYYVLGYVEVLEYAQCGSKHTSLSCHSLPLPSDLFTSVYVEAPYWNVMQDECQSSDILQKSLEKFNQTLPVFALLGENVTPPDVYDVNAHENLQLVMKYLKAYNEGNLDDVISSKHPDTPIEIGKKYKDIPTKECCELIKDVMPFGFASEKVMETLFLKYMERRCKFMEESPFFRFNAGTSHPIVDKTGKKIGEWTTKKMRSTVFEIMIEEVTNFCRSSVSWSSETHKQLIYDNGGFMCMCSHPERLPQSDQEKLHNIGVQFPTQRDRLSTQLFHDYLSAALNVKKDPKTGEISFITEKKFVLTTDFVQKILNIHERKECGMPVVIEGETGVGKTFLLELLSSLWNNSWNEQLILQRQRIKDTFCEKLSALIDHYPNNTILKEVQRKLERTETVSEGKLVEVLIHKDPTSSKAGDFLYKTLQQKFQLNTYDPVLASIERPSGSIYKSDFSELLKMINKNCTVDLMAAFLYGILYGSLKGTFYKLSIHSAMKPQEIRDFFNCVQVHADSLMACYEDSIKAKIKFIYEKPIVTVFLDEINTSSYPGFMKEIIIDGMMDGKNISKSNNIFIVAACNPHRGHSLASIENKFSENWFNPTYHVHNLPLTLKLLMWNYRQLQEADEVEYINEKFRLTYNGMNSMIRRFLSEQISKAQKLIRNFAQKNLINNGIPDKEAKLCSESTVSQRDIQRVFLLYSWLKNWFQKHFKKRFQKEFEEQFPNNHNNEEKKKFFITIHALNVAIALVYYFRLNDEYRNLFLKKMYVDRSVGEHGAPDDLQKSLDTELKWVNDNVIIPLGIAPTDALKENIYAMIVCTMAKIPVIIIGPPGSSKTLSFKIVTSNLLGGKSSSENLKDVEIFKALDPHPYQCSHKSTSNEIDLVFQRAINRQRTSDESGINSMSVVLLDEAGLPDESLKVLHYFLDCPKVAFVGISNSVLDAAKTNRAISIYRTDTSHDDLIQLAKYSLYNGCLPNTISEDVRDVIERFVKLYEEMMKKRALKNFFGLRDFIHFFTYLGRNIKEFLSPQSVLTALEQNFNGMPACLNEILRAFLQVVGSQPNQLQQRSLIEILKSSFKYEPRDFSFENQVRYKLLIDSSEDQSLIRQLFAFGIFSREQTKIYSCSKLPGDGESQKLYTTSAIRYSVTKGHTLIIYQAEDIQECFYDLFNQRFTHIGGYHYTNVSVGPTIKTTRVSPYFNCAMIISKSEVEQTKKPFLNRFEKFFLSHEILYREKLSTCENYIKLMMNDIKNNVLEFVQMCEESSFYGFTDQTVDSLMLSVIPMSQECCSNFTCIAKTHIEECQCNSKKMVFIKSLLENLKGIQIQILGTCSEMSHLINYVYSLINYDEFVDEIFQSHEDVNKYVKESIESFDKIHYKSISTRAFVTKEEFPLIFLKELVTIHVYKQLLQLMTPEALVFHSKLIHSYYIHCYLTHQSHFSLAKIISSFKHQRSTKHVVKKFLCYTRTSPAVFIIPQHFSRNKLIEDKLDFEELETFFETKKNSLHTYIITDSTSQEKLNQVLEEFFSSRLIHENGECDTDILVLAADMNNLHKDTINHARLLIEEIEVSYSEKLFASKLVFVVLHFPCNLFYSCCYPSLFMNGWQHVYMDMIGQVKSECSIDMEQWLSICLLQHQDQKVLTHALSFVEDKMMNDWLKEWVSMISKSIQFPRTKNFPKDDEINDVKCYWDRLLFTLKSDETIKKRFVSFWNQDAMAKLSEQAATYALTYKSTCTLTNTIKATVQSSFKDVVLYFLSIANQSMAINTIFRNEDIRDSSASVKLFNDILAVLPIPQSLQEVKIQLTVLNCQKEKSTSEILMNAPQFPFFNIIFQLVEGILNKALRTTVASVIAINKSTEESFILDKDVFKGAKSENELVTKEMVRLLKQNEEEYEPIKVAIKAMEFQKDFWDFYCEDALTTRLFRPLGKFSRQHLKHHLLQIDSNDIHMKLSCLHYNLRMLWLKAKKLSLLRTLDECFAELDFGGIESSTGKNTDTDVSTCTNTNLEVQADDVIKMLYMNISNGELNVSVFRKLAYLYNQMMALFTVSSTSMCGSVRNKWIVLCVVFHLVSLRDRIAIKTTMEDFVVKFVHELNTYITSDTCIKMNLLTKIIGSIAFTEEDTVKFLKSNSCPVEMYSIIECISMFYINYLYDFLTEEDAGCIFQYIDAVLSNSSKLAEPYKTNFKYIFSCLLGSSNNISTESNPLALFICKVRSVLGSLIASEELDDCLYIPVTFKYCHLLQHLSSTKISTHVLSDVYFEVIVKKLQAKENTLSELVSLYNKIKYSFSLSASNRALLTIEKQAVVYVIIDLLAVNLLQNENERRASFEEVYEQLNTIIDSNNAVVSKRKNAITGNGLVLLMKMLISCKKNKVLLSMMTTQFDSFLRDFNCLHPINACIIKETNRRLSFLPTKSDSKFIEYLKKDHRDQYKIFNEVHENVKKIVDTRKLRGVDTLMDIARSCYSKNTKDPSLLTKWTFNMSLLLSVYYEVFLKKDVNRSNTMSDVLSQKMSQYVQPEYLKLILWLAKPSSSDSCGRGLTSYDKLKHFFVEDEKHKAHVHCLIQLAAVIFGNTEQSCHLFDHLFNPENISTDFLPGSILASTGSCYSRVMSVSENNSLYYTSRKSLTWHSLLFTQWMNYGMMCLSIIINPSNAKQLPFHDKPSIVNVCFNNLKALWQMLTTDCCLACEDTELLADYGAQNLYKVLKSNSISSSFAHVRWKENDQFDSLSEYEKILHCEVFKPSWKSMKSMKKFVNFGSTIGEHMRELTANVPELNIRSVNPLRAFMMTVLSSTNLCNSNCQFYVLYQFIICRPSLNVAAKLLPSLISLYNRINARFTHKVTSDIAKSNSVGVVLESMLQQFFPKDEHNKSKMQKVLELYSNYKKLVSNDFISQLPVLSLQMNFYDLVTTVDGEDALFKLINLLVKQYNEFIQTVHQHFSSKQYFGEHVNYTKIPLVEVIQQTCAFGTSTSHHDLMDMEEMILKYCSMDALSKDRSVCYDRDPTILSDCVPEVFSLTGIQNEIIQKFITHKQFIDIGNFRKKFAFSEVSFCEEAACSLFYTATYGYEDTVEQLDKFIALKTPLNEGEIYEYSSTFHSLSYDSLLSVCGGLCLVLKMLLERAQVAQDQIFSLTVQSFLTKYYFSDSNGRVLDEVGIVMHDAEHIRSGLTVNQYEKLCHTQVTVVMSVSKLFHEWVKVGFYDFSHLPHSMKIPLSQNSDKLVQEWIEGNDDKNIKDVMHLLFKFEQLFCQADNHKIKKMGDIVMEKSIIIKTNANAIFSLPIQYYVYAQLKFRSKLLDSSRDLQKENHDRDVKNSINLTPEIIEEMNKELECMPLSPPPVEYEIRSPSPVDLEEENDTTSTCTEDNDTELKLEKVADTMTSEDVAQFLDKEGFVETAQIVRKNNDNGSTLYDVTQRRDSEELGEFGITQEVDKLRFCVLFRRELTIKAGLQLSLAAVKYEPKELAKLLKGVQRTERFAEAFEDESIDGEMLLQANDGFFKELNVPAFIQKIIIKNLQKELDKEQKQQD